MKIIRGGTSKGVKGSIITLGNFDGVHLGHQRILKKVVERAYALGLPSMVYTFEPHPMKILSPGKSPPLITDIKDKIRLIESFGIDYLMLAKFTKGFAQKHPEEFVRDALFRDLSVKEVWVGHDFSFGKSGKGTVENLKNIAKYFHFKVFVIPALKKAGSIVSSSRIRKLIKEGSVEAASMLLGRPFSIKGSIVKGRRIGKTLGHPTANLKYIGDLIPKDGVYAGLAAINGNLKQSVINIGVAPTFNKRKNTVVEAHILDFRGSIYGKNIKILFLKRLRDEFKFKSPEELSRRIFRDIKRARRILINKL